MKKKRSYKRKLLDELLRRFNANNTFLMREYPVSFCRKIIDEFDNWMDAMTLITETKRSRKKAIYSDKDLIRLIQEEKKRTGNVPMVSKMKQGETISKRFGSFYTALDIAGIRHYLSNEELLQLIIDKQKKLIRVPYKREIENAELIVRRFGSFKKGLALAGYTREKIRSLEREFVLHKLRKTIDRHGLELVRYKFKHMHLLIKHFKGLTGALDAINEKVNTPGRKTKYTNENLLIMLRKDIERLGRHPKSREIKYYYTLVSRFGSLKNALSELTN